MKEYRGSLSGANTADIVVVVLIVVVDIAIVEVHIPRIVRIVGIGSRRPVVGRFYPDSLRHECPPQTDPQKAYGLLNINASADSRGFSSQRGDPGAQ